ncbi:MAG: hypothetical protein ACRDUW_04985 [Pseudonocardiaceae bacterium]
MGAAWESVNALLSDAAAASAQAMAAGANQSFTIRASNGLVTLESIATDFQDPGEFRIRSPRMHDAVNGLRIWAQDESDGPQCLEYFRQVVYSQDTLTVEAVFSAAPVATHISNALMTFHYDDIPGLAGNFLTWAECAPRIVDYLITPHSPVSGATAGDWGAGEAINALVDVFKADTQYALIGYTMPVPFHAWGIQGVDIGNLIFGGPGSLDPHTTRRYFPYLSDCTGYPAIPVVNSQNKATTNVMVADEVASTDYEFSLIWAQLSR